MEAEQSNDRVDTLYRLIKPYPLPHSENRITKPIDFWALGLAIYLERRTAGRVPCTTPNIKWLVDQVHLWAEHWKIPMGIGGATMLAEHILGNWLTIEDSKVQNLCRAARLLQQAYPLQADAALWRDLDAAVKALEGPG